MHDVRGDSEGEEALRAAVKEGVEHVLAGLELGDLDTPAPAGVVAHARHAARSGVSLDLLLRGYAASDRVLSGLMFEERNGCPRQVARRLMAEHGGRVDRLLASVAVEFESESDRLSRSSSDRLSARIESLLVGADPWEVGDLEYDFTAWHLALVIRGPDAERAARHLAGAVSRHTLIVPREQRTTWVWLGGGAPVEVADVERVLPSCAAGAAVAIGEPRRRLDGWRLSHHEALAAFQVMLRRPRRLIRGSEVLLLAAVLNDRLWSRSLLETYMVPLDRKNESGVALRETLRAYFDADQNAVTTAAALGVDRHTVQRRLKTVERRLGRLLSTCHAELRVALELEEITGSGEPDPTLSLPG